MKTNIKAFIEKVQRIVDNKELHKLTLTAPKDKTADLKKIIITAVNLKKGYCFNFVYRHSTKDITKNYEIAEGLELISEAIDQTFNNAEGLSASEKLQFIYASKWKTSIKIDQLSRERPRVALAR